MAGLINKKAVIRYTISPTNSSACSLLYCRFMVHSHAPSEDALEKVLKILFYKMALSIRAFFSFSAFFHYLLFIELLLCAGYVTISRQPYA